MFELQSYNIYKEMMSVVHCIMCILTKHSESRVSLAHKAGVSIGDVLYMSSSQAILRCSFLSPTYGFIRKVVLIPHHILKERGVFKLSNHSSQCSTRSSELKLKPDAD